MVNSTSAQRKNESDVSTMNEIEKTIDVNLPISTVYNQWTQFEEFPKFMEGVKQVRQLNDKQLQWRAKIGGKEKEWTAEIVEQVPDKRIAWQSTSGARNNGVVTFDKITEDKTRIYLTIDYEPEGAIENAGDALGILARRIDGDLKRFKEYLESRKTESGAWRGEIRGGKGEQ